MSQQHADGIIARRPHARGPRDVQALSVRPPAAVRARPRDRARPRVRGPRRRGAARASRERSRRARSRRPVDRDGACTFPNRVGLAAGLDKNAAHIDGLADARLRLHRMRHGHAARAARQPEAAHVPPAAGARAHQPPRLQQRRRRARSSPTSSARAIAASSASTSARTSTRRTSAPPTTTSRACAPCTRGRTTSRSTSRSPNTKGLRDLQAEDALAALLGALKREQTALAQTARQYVPLAIKIAPDLTRRRDRRHRARCWSGTRSTA